MNPVVKIVIALLVAAAAWALLHFVPTIPLPLVLVAATVITALLVSVPATQAPAGAAYATQDEAEDFDDDVAPSASGPREEGQVKWFNVSKGFGFITKDNGEEIFVHFRSIRGEGRRGLRDGQRVSFVESRTDKGPQAEDVEGL